MRVEMHVIKSQAEVRKKHGWWNISDRGDFHIPIYSAVEAYISVSTGPTH